MTTARKTQMGEPDAWVSLRAASEMLGQTRHTVLMRIVKGELTGQVIAGRTVVSRESVERVKGAA